ncbi:hypothetical protein ACNQ1O_01215 [Mycoplasma sp. B6188]|uniref:hypothetical protein n=1 Tax=Mycoplasma sp. B6188 TaxID=3401673 RepID=UPI003AAD7C09
MKLKKILFTVAPVASLVALPLAAVSCKSKEQKMAQELYDLQKERAKFSREDTSDANIASLQKIQNWSERFDKLTKEEKKAVADEYKKLTGRDFGPYR